MRRVRLVPRSLFSRLVLVLLAGLITIPWRVRPPERLVCASDALQAKAIAGLANFADWLQRNRTTGFIGEVGWPSNLDSRQWNELADIWYEAADSIGLPVTAWAAGSWPAEYPMAVYRPRSRESDVDTPGPQAAVVERHLSTAGDLRGVALAAGSFAASDTNFGFASGNPGLYGRDYTYETAGSYTYLAARGVRLIRLAVNWERLQPKPFGPLSASEVARVRLALERAGRARLTVVLDLHGYGDFAAGGVGGGQIRRLTLGSPQLPTTALADFWRRYVRAVANQPAVVAYGLLNEPTRLASTGRAGALIWERAAQQSVNAIRRAGSEVPVTVSGYMPMGPLAWGQMHPRAWIHDPLDRVAYESHAYFDSDGSGHYWASYADELRLAEQAARPRPALCHRLTPTAPSALAAAAPDSAKPKHR